MLPKSSPVIVDLLGFLTGSALYVMLVAMVWRERAAEGAPFLSRRGRLPLLMGLCGVTWNVVALLSFSTRVTGDGQPSALIVAIAFSALGFLPAVVVHSLLDGRETAASRRLIRSVLAVAYGLSFAAAVLHIVAASRGGPVPSPAALLMLTIGFTTLTASLLLLTRAQPIGRRGIWVAALSIFAVSALHFGRHGGNESWWVELVGHHASLALALAILLQDYRFALADLFLKNAIALLMFMGVSLTVFSTAMASLDQWQDASGRLDPRGLTIFFSLWMATALTFPWLRRLSGLLVDRAVLRRPDYEKTLASFARALDAADTEEAVRETAATALRTAVSASYARVVPDPRPASEGLLLTGADARSSGPEAPPLAILRLTTVHEPHLALALGPLSAGRRLLSDDVRLLEAVGRLAARRIDVLRVEQERLHRDVREQQMQRLATEAELRALRAQLNPHFLFNALTTIGYLIQRTPPRALETLLRLTAVLRGVLRRSTTEFCTLGEEIDLIVSYLDIERARFEERLQVTVEARSDARATLIPALLLQPLVENAVKHGIAPRKSGGALRVSAEVIRGRLRVLVEDSGVGFDVERPRDRSAVGLTNVAQRLQAHYGGAASMEIRSTTGGGTVIRLDLPAESHSLDLDTNRRRTG